MPHTDFGDVSRDSLVLLDLDQRPNQRGRTGLKPPFDTFVAAQAVRSDHVVRSGPRNLDSGLSEISIVFQAAVPKLVASKYTTSGVRRPSEL